MPTVEDVRWFKEQFHAEIEVAARGTPFSVDMLTAIACQETGSIWPVLRKRQLNRGRILEMCVGDTLDEGAGRKAFPRTKAELVAKANGDRMFAIARQALEEMSQYIPGYQKVAKVATKFCHGFGVFQYDLQFFVTDPDYFLEKRYADFAPCLQKCLEELSAALQRLRWQDRTTLSDYEMASVAVVYNCGRFDASKGLRQGHRDNGTYYGEAVLEFIRLAKSVGLEGAPAPRTGPAPVPPPTPVEATGSVYEVDVRETLLLLRSEPRRDPENPSANVVAKLPDGLTVRAVTDRKVSGYLEVETSLSGAHYRGFASAKYLKPVPGGSVVVVTPAAAPPSSGITAVYMPRKDGVVTRRTSPAGPGASALRVRRRVGTLRQARERISHARTSSSSLRR
jgi:hypothetical protein